MAVQLPTAADVRKVRETARKNAAENLEVARTPLLAVLGAGDAAVATVTKAATVVRTRATAQAEDAQSRIAGLPQKLTIDELRKTVDELRTQAQSSYAGLAERGEKALGQIRKQPQVKQAIETFESYTAKLDAHDVAEKALSTVSTQTRSTGEKAAQAAQRLTGQAVSNISEATKDASEAVAKAGAELEADVKEAGAEVASTTRSTTRRAANRTAPKTTTRKTNGSASS